MNEPNIVPAEMLDAAAEAVKEMSPRTWVWTGLKPATVAEAALQAAGVPALLTQIEGLRFVLQEQEPLVQEAQREAREARVRAAKLEMESLAKDARIAQLEAALADRICEGCNTLVANVGMLHLCGCEDQRNLCSACRAACACAGGE